MRSGERNRALSRAPRLLLDALGRGRYDFNYDMMPMTVRRMSLAKRVNLVKSGLNLLHRRSSSWGYPLHLQAELTNYCNLRCPVCPAGIRAVKRDRTAMTLGMFERLMAEVGPYLLTTSLWAWGESTLHPELHGILDIMQRYNVISLLSTNGQWPDRDRVVRAVTDAPPTYLVVALDGLTDETNSRFRIGAKLEPALEDVRRIAAIKRANGAQLPILHMRYIVMKHNQHELPDLLEFARAHDFDMLTVRTLSIIDTDSEQPHLDLLPDQHEVRPYDYRDGARIKRQDFICQQPFWFPTVFADGTVVACEQDYNAQLAFGVMDDSTSFSDLWFSRRAARVRRQVRDRPESLSFCVNCPYRDRDSTHVSVRAHIINKLIDFADLPLGAL